GRIAQLLDNLLSNAVKFTPERGHITVSLGTEGHSAWLSVADDGMGISADDQARVFERFFRTDLATSRAVQGTGLGLAICKAIVDSHNGTISIESQPSRGTTFRVHLPLRSALDGDPSVPGALGTRATILSTQKCPAAAAGGLTVAVKSSPARESVRCVVRPQAASAASIARMRSASYWAIATVFGSVTVASPGWAGLGSSWGVGDGSGGWTWLVTGGWLLMSWACA